MKALQETDSSRPMNSAGASHKAYRPDIDGLRAIAVMSVIAFHLSHEYLPGGFLGVDAFFVLSGFLIGSIIFDELRQNSFSIVEFYDRRIRRIMPALTVVLLVTTVASLAILLPADLIGYSKSLLSTLAFVANIYFWRDTNYFARAAEEKPLLHMWSLGIEEQFYIFFPLVLFLLARFWVRGTFFVLSVCTLASLLLNIAAIHVGGESPAFFLLPTRAWELGFGAMLATLPERLKPGKYWSSPLSLVGLALLLVGLAWPIKHVFIPVALPVVAGVTLLIACGGGGIANRLLSAKGLVGIGLISYSLYLWHWPVIVLWQYWLVRDLSAIERVLCVALVMLVSFASWKYVERPFRGRSLRVGVVRGSALVATLMLAGASGIIFRANGFPARLSPEVARINAASGTHYRCPVSDYLTLGSSRACVMNLPSRDTQDAEVVLLGNSHAQMYAPVWAELLAAKRTNGLLVPVNACLPTVTANVSVPCIKSAEGNLAAILRLPKLTTVVLAFDWKHGVNGLVDGSGRVIPNAGGAGLNAAVDALVEVLQAAGKKVVLIGPIALPGWDVASVLSRQIAFQRPQDMPRFQTVDSFMKRFGPTIEHFSSRRDIAFVRVDQVQCDSQRCDFLRDGESLFSDDNHLAANQLWRFKPSIADAYDAVSTKR